MFPSSPWSKLICFYDSAEGPFKQLLKKGCRKRRIRITSYLGVNSVVEWLGKCLIFSADLPAQLVAFLSLLYPAAILERVTDDDSSSRFDRFHYLAPLYSCDRVQTTSTARDIVVAPWLASFSSEILARLHHLLIIIFFLFFPGDSGAGDRRGSSVPVVRRQLLRIPASPVEVSPF